MKRTEFRTPPQGGGSVVPINPSQSKGSGDLAQKLAAFHREASGRGWSRHDYAAVARLLLEYGRKREAQIWQQLAGGVQL